MKVKELAKKHGVSRQYIYKIAKDLGRIPTSEELYARQGKIGRPSRDYDYPEIRLVINLRDIDKLIRVLDKLNIITIRDLFDYMINNKISNINDILSINE